MSARLRSPRVFVLRARASAWYNIDMQKGDILDLEIASSGMEGEGVARHDGMVVFVPRTLVGEKVRVMVKEVRSRFARAGVVKLLQASPHRVKPRCRAFFKCGSCDMQHIDYPLQLEIKRNNVRACLAKTCGRDFDVAPTVASPLQYGYRNKIQVPLGVEGGKICAGYFAEGTHRLVPFPSFADGSCPMYDEGMQKILETFLSFADSQGLTCYDESTHKGLLRHFVARKVGDAYGVVIVGNGARLPHAEELVRAYRALGVEFSLFFCSNTARTNVILQGPITTICGADSLPCEVLGIKAQVAPRSFMQINDRVRDLIYSEVARVASRFDGAEVIDAYSGVGILTNILAAHAAHVVGIEIVPEAVADADRLTAFNGNSAKVTNICGDCAQCLPSQVADITQRGAHSIVVLDPPRKGCDARVIRALCSALPDEIVYVSCNPATLARDIAAILPHYDPVSITPYDMFPQTKHVETLVVLQKKK